MGTCAAIWFKCRKLYIHVLRIVMEMHPVLKRVLDEIKAAATGNGGHPLNNSARPERIKLGAYDIENHGRKTWKQIKDAAREGFKKHHTEQEPNDYN